MLAFSNSLMENWQKEDLLQTYLQGRWYTAAKEKRQRSAYAQGGSDCEYHISGLSFHLGCFIGREGLFCERR